MRTLLPPLPSSRMTRKSKRLVAHLITLGGGFTPLPNVMLDKVMFFKLFANDKMC
jgi:hypothetical protein